MKQGAGALLVLPDGRVVLQRRTKDAPTGAGLLTFFGGLMELGETPEKAARRELSEETDLPIATLEFVPAVMNFVTLKDSASSEKWQANIFKVEIPSISFKVFEGDGAEVYEVEEVMRRQDLTILAERVFDKLFGGRNGIEHY